jgi:hypothetical protein
MTLNILSLPIENYFINVYIPALLIASIPLWELIKRNKVFPVHCMLTYRRRHLTPLTINLGTRWRWKTSLLVVKGVWSPEPVRTFWGRDRFLVSAEILRKMLQHQWIMAYKLCTGKQLWPSLSTSLISAWRDWGKTQKFQLAKMVSRLRFQHSTSWIQEC